jgi:hypothetical protein
MDDEPDENFELKERFVWKWHPHGWMVAILIILLIFLTIKFAT